MVEANVAKRDADERIATQRGFHEIQKAGIKKVKPLKRRWVK